MAKKQIQINPAIYATDYLFRRDMIWKGISSQGSHISDPIAYLNRMEKKYGPIVKEAAGLAYPLMTKDCLAMVETKLADYSELAARRFRKVEKRYGIGVDRPNLIY